MENNKKISVIGATGNIGAPVVRHLAKSGFQVSILVRNVQKAQQMFGDLANIQFIQADLEHVDSLRNALVNTEYLYLNLSTNALDLKIPFAAEREGVRNILAAVDRKSIKQIIAISGLGAIDNFYNSDKFTFIPNIIRKSGHKLLKESGIPYTILHCTWFIDNCVFFQRNKTYSVFGNTKDPMYFTNCYDYSMNVINAIGNQNAFFKEFPIQGRKGYKHTEAAQKFLSVYSKESKVMVLSNGLLFILALFNKELKFVKHLADFSNHSIEYPLVDEFGTYSVLGSPKFDLEEYAEWLKSENFYSYLEKSKSDKQ